MREREEDFEDLSDTSMDFDAPLPETDNKRWELDEEPLLAALRHELKKRLNKVGVEELMSWLRISLNKTGALTNLDDLEINDLLKYEIEALIHELRVNSTKWGVKSRAVRTSIVRWMFGIMKKHLKRAYKDGERKYRSESYGYNEHHKHDDVRNDEIGGGFRLPFFGGRKRTRPQNEEYVEDRF